jgi:hypothetical protein
MLDMIAMTILHFDRERREARWNEEEALWFVEVPGRLRRGAGRLRRWLRRLRPESDLDTGSWPREVWRSRRPHEA